MADARAVGIGPEDQLAPREIHRVPDPFPLTFAGMMAMRNCTSTAFGAAGRGVGRGSVNLRARWNATIWVA